MEIKGEGFGGWPPKGLWSPCSSGCCKASSMEEKSSLERHSNDVEFFLEFAHHHILEWWK